jgi:hypothetical protein
MFEIFNNEYMGFEHASYVMMDPVVCSQSSEILPSWWVSLY